MICFNVHVAVERVQKITCHHTSPDFLCLHRSLSIVRFMENEANKGTET